MKSLILYTLITVSSSGAVYHSDGYKSVHDCLEAKNLAVSGKTIEQQAADEAKAKADEVAREAAWAAAHPPRKPANKWETVAVEERVQHPDWYAGTSTHSCPDDHPYHVTANLLIQDDPPASCDGLAGVTISNNRAITTAECVIEVKDKP